MAHVNNICTLGRRILYLRTERHITQTELAILLNKDVLEIQLLEVGICDFDISDLFTIKNIFNISFQHLFSC